MFCGPYQATNKMLPQIKLDLNDEIICGAAIEKALSSYVLQLDLGILRLLEADLSERYLLMHSWC